MPWDPEICAPGRVWLSVDDKGLCCVHTSAQDVIGQGFRFLFCGHVEPICGLCGAPLQGAPKYPFRDLVVYTAIVEVSKNMVTCALCFEHIEQAIVNAVTDICPESSKCANPKNIPDVEHEVVNILGPLVDGSPVILVLPTDYVRKTGLFLDGRKAKWRGEIYTVVGWVYSDDHPRCCEVDLKPETPPEVAHAADPPDLSKYTSSKVPTSVPGIPDLTKHLSPLGITEHGDAYFRIPEGVVHGAQKGEVFSCKGKRFRACNYKEGVDSTVIHGKLEAPHAEGG